MPSIPVLIYTTSGCQACRMTKLLLDNGNIAYREISIDDNPKAGADLRAAGHKTLPVVIVNGLSRWGSSDVWSGFQLDKIRALRFRVKDQS